MANGGILGFSVPGTWIQATAEESDPALMV